MSVAPYQRCERRSSGRLREAVMSIGTGAGLASKTSTGRVPRADPRVYDDARERCRSEASDVLAIRSPHARAFLQIIAARLANDPRTGIVRGIAEVAMTRVVRGRTVPFTAVLAFIAALALPAHAADVAPDVLTKTQPNAVPAAPNDNAAAQPKSDESG